MIRGNWYEEIDNDEADTPTKSNIPTNATEPKSAHSRTTVQNTCTVQSDHRRSPENESADRFSITVSPISKENVGSEVSLAPSTRKNRATVTFKGPTRTEADAAPSQVILQSHHDQIVNFGTPSATASSTTTAGLATSSLFNKTPSLAPSSVTALSFITTHMAPDRTQSRDTQLSSFSGMTALTTIAELADHVDALSSTQFSTPGKETIADVQQNNVELESSGLPNPDTETLKQKNSETLSIERKLSDKRSFEEQSLEQQDPKHHILDHENNAKLKFDEHITEEQSPEEHSSKSQSSDQLQPEQQNPEHEKPEQENVEPQLENHPHQQQVIEHTGSGLNESARNCEGG